MVPKELTKKVAWCMISRFPFGALSGRGIVFLAAAAISPLSAAQSISLRGAQDGYYEKAEYTVDSVITVEPGKTMTIEAGSIVRFRKYGELRVRGKLEALGTPTDMAVFTSIRHHPDSSEPAPFDWNGIAAHGPEAAVEMKYSRISYASVGLNVSSTKADISLRSVYFHDNGTADVVLGDSSITVASGELVDYPPRTEGTAVKDSSIVPPAPAAELRPSIEAGNERMLRVVRIGSIVTGAVGVAGVVGGQVAAIVYQGRYESAADPRKAAAVRKTRDRFVGLRNAGLAVFGSGAIGITVTLLL